jgi:hypothetical protein
MVMSRPGNSGPLLAVRACPICKNPMGNLDFVNVDMYYCENYKTDWQLIDGKLETAPPYYFWKSKSIIRPGLVGSLRTLERGRSQ